MFVGFGHLCPGYAVIDPVCGLISIAVGELLFAIGNLVA